MKNLLIIFLSCLLLTGSATNADAAFIFKRKHSSDTSASADKTPKKQHSKKWVRKHEARLDRERDWRLHHWNEQFMPHEKEAKKSLKFMLLGLVLLPLGIPAIVHAIRSLKKKDEWYYHFTAITCLIFGSLEILTLALFITILLFAIL